MVNKKEKDFVILLIESNRLHNQLVSIKQHTLNMYRRIYSFSISVVNHSLPFQEKKCISFTQRLMEINNKCRNFLQSVPETVDSGAAAAAVLSGSAASSVPAAVAAVASGGATMVAAAQPRRIPAQPILLNEQQMLKLRGELDIVHGNMRVFSEMLAAHSAGVQDKAASELVQAREDMELLTVGFLLSFVVFSAIFFF